MNIKNFRRIMEKWYNINGCGIKVEQARDIICKALSRYNKPYIAFSGGKDSTCILHLVLQQKPDIMVLHWDFGPYKLPRVIENQILENAKKIGARNIQVYTSKEYQKGKMFLRFSNVISFLRLFLN
jgi:PP-loop superfamily ATP-utilizing enzyme